ncbi:uncharacterized protein SPAPADRAFT_155869, partial [Spathaspora passalidarum NRRL Y-27907]
MLMTKRKFEEDEYFIFSTPPTSSASASATPPPPSTKRVQTSRIHSEAHIRTIQMMMQAQLELQKHEKKQDHQELIMDEDAADEKSTFVQRP